MATETLRGEPMRGVKEELLGTNPYFFGEGSFKDSRISPHGHFRVLERFSEKFKLPGGIDNYRLAVLEAEPMTFALPSHWDAEELFYVMEGKGRISILFEKKRESHDISKGDVMRVPSGAIVYLINKDGKQQLRIAMLLQTISIPGQFEEFYPAGGNDPKSFFASFSTEVNEAALNTSEDNLEKLSGHQMKGVMVKISQEQIESMVSEQSSNDQTSWGPLNLLKQNPSDSNDHGKIYEIKSNDYTKLRHMDVNVSIVNINSGSMMVHHYNSKATMLAIVVEGRGFIKMVCPHIEGGDAKAMTNLREHKTGQYKRLRSELSAGSVFVNLACHPVALVSTGAEDLQLLCFGINAENNMKCYLAGSNNVLLHMEKMAKELAFTSPVEVVEKVLGAQQSSLQGQRRSGSTLLLEGSTQVCFDLQCKWK